MCVAQTKDRIKANCSKGASNLTIDTTEMSNKQKRKLKYNSVEPMERLLKKIFLERNVSSNKSLSNQSTQNGQDEGKQHFGKKNRKRKNKSIINTTGLERSMELSHTGP